MFILRRIPSETALKINAENLNSEVNEENLLVEHSTICVGLESIEAVEHLQLYMPMRIRLNR